MPRHLSLGGSGNHWATRQGARGRSASRSRSGRVAMRPNGQTALVIPAWQYRLRKKGVDKKERTVRCAFTTYPFSVNYMITSGTRSSSARSSPASSTGCRQCRNRTGGGRARGIQQGSSRADAAGGTGDEADAAFKPPTRCRNGRRPGKINKRGCVCHGWDLTNRCSRTSLPHWLPGRSSTQTKPWAS
jgi:hypothetical protein